MIGPEVSVESYSVDGVPHIITITDKMVTEVPFFVELGHTEPSRLSSHVQDDIRRVAEAAIKAIGMKNGPTHTEIKVTPDGAKLVEIAARLGGDFITSHLVPLSTGVDMIECSFATLLGEKVHYQKQKDKGAAIRFIQGKSGVLKEVVGLDKAKSLPGIVDIEIYKNIGEKIIKPENSSDRIGHIIAKGDTADEAAQNAELALSSIVVTVE
jgi:biotin carboxylase